MKSREWGFVIGDSLKRPHEQLKVWQDAMELVEAIYSVTRTFPGDERFGLTAQIRRAAVSFPSNIAEGAARGSTGEYLRFLAIARGSISELDTQIQIAARLGHIRTADRPIALVNRVFAKLNGLIRAVDRNRDTK